MNYHTAVVGWRQPVKRPAILLTKHRVTLSSKDTNSETVTVTAMIIVPENDNEFFEVQRALSPYVIQSTKVENDYDFLSKLGRGSFGYVLLANPKQTRATLLMSLVGNKDNASMFGDTLKNKSLANTPMGTVGAIVPPNSKPQVGSQATGPVIP
jgi:hypothetical protein